MSPRSIALAVAALATTLGAQAQSSYNLYGVVDLSLASMQTSGAAGSAANTRTTKVDGNNMVTSYIGFKGVEDLGGGLKAGFALEAFLRPDVGGSGRTGADVFWGRAANVYLSSDLGKLTLGRQGNLVFGQVAGYNPFGGAFGLSPAVRLTYGAVGNDVGDSGVSNAITYQTPNLAGFTASVQVQLGEDSTKAQDTTYAGAVSYTAGPFSAGASMQRVRSATAPKSALLAGQSQNFGLVSASYDFGVAKLFAQYGQLGNNGYTGASNIDTDVVQLGASVPVTKDSKVLVSYGQSKEEPASGTTPAAVKHDIFTLAYDLWLSKRTDVYAAYMYDKEKAAGFKAGNSVVFGVRHAF